MSDYIVRATAAGSQIRALAATTRDMVEYARSAHNTSPVATAALGRLMTAGGIMGVMMKGKNDILTLQVRGDGPIGKITVTADSSANVKGYVDHPEVIIHANAKGKLDVAGAVGNGILNVVKDLGMKEPYVGQTVLQTGEIADDLTYYFAASEQIPSCVGLGVLMNRDNTVKQAGGFLLQLMPFADEKVVANLEKKMEDVKPVTQMLEEGNSPEQILEILLGDLGLEINDRISTGFFCNCSKNKMEKALISVGKKDIQEMIDDGESIEMKCHFCNSHYIFTVEELKEIQKKRKGTADVPKTWT